MPIKDSKPSPPNERPDSGWFLEGFAGEGKTWIIAIQPFPFAVGRREDCHLRLPSPHVSRRHAEIYQRNQELWLREFGSTNGTFVNRQCLTGECRLSDGDIIHFGPFEFRISRDHTVVPLIRAGSNEPTQLVVTNLPQGFVEGEKEFGEMLRQQAVIPYYQPIVRLSDQQIVGYELLGRGGFKGVPSNPPSLLRIARNLGKEIELSELFRRIGIQRAGQLGESYQLFFNTVPAEMKLRHLQLSLRELRLQAPLLPLAMEVHETAVTDVALMKSIRELLDELNIQLVYDDFGAGQARLVELIEVPPDYLKFDIALIRNIHRQSPAAQKVLQTLACMAGDLGIKTLAEGVEVKEELEVCVRFGFGFAQGYYFGKPSPYFI